jgi:hypothetical protein
MATIMKRAPPENVSATDLKMMAGEKSAKKLVSVRGRQFAENTARRISLGHQSLTRDLKSSVLAREL